MKDNFEFLSQSNFIGLAANLVHGLMQIESCDLIMVIYVMSNMVSSQVSSSEGLI